MQIHVKFFAILRELAGTSSTTVEVPEGCTVAQLLNQLFTEETRSKRFPTSMLYAVNQKYAEASHVLHEDDEVVFVPPVSGG